MTNERTKLQLDLFEKALLKLKDALSQNETEYVRDSVIQRFEFTFEMAWKSLRRILLDRGENVPDSAYETLQAAFKAGLIKDADLWRDIRDNRNSTSHTYQEIVAIKVAAFIRGTATSAFDELLTTLKPLA